MCGRFTLTKEEDELLDRFEAVGLSFPYVPRYNVAPRQYVTAVIRGDNGNRVGQLQWGLIPSWAKDEKMASQLLNAKAETVLEKPSFRNSFLHKRCLIPADGFYEWRKTPRGKQPMRIQMKHRGIFSMAGLYETWSDPAQPGRSIATCTILTTAPNSLMEPIHDRMPVILRREDEDIWLSRDMTDKERLLQLCRPFPSEEMMAYPVSPLVGSVKNESPECIQEAEYIPDEPLLF
ncbi:SOS response-associated peptidase [Paenibacillus gansuensis]|uniref:Abasic site processing protein n=1 Tax=Paenibacillus gansuensis TaxID=306542 RepID=A0ABW5PMJ5_9BACL